MAVELPWLALEQFAGTLEPAHPFAVSETCNGVARLALGNRAALRAGVRPGMRPGTAYALCPDLRVRPRDHAAERAALERLAAWTGRFTPQVVLSPPAALLLEVAGSERLFGGMEAIIRALRQGVAELGYRTRIALAPTPNGARLLTTSAGDTRVHGQDELRRALAGVPLERLGLPRGSLERLRRLGLKRLGELLRMPRDGVARRYGAELVDLLDRTLGRRADPQEPFRPPQRYHGRLLLPAEVEEHPRLLIAARRLLGELSGLLEARGEGIQSMEWTLIHRDHAPTPLPLGLASPGRDAERMEALLAERLERFELPAPVLELELCSGPFHPLASHNGALFTDPASRLEAARLLERLIARLGEAAIHGIETVADHRPERGWRRLPAGRRPLAIALPDRPLWLLAAPLPLARIDGRPHYRGVLHLLRGPERIESGWWDGAGVTRDYFAAENPAGMRLWIFREPRHPERWFLHGRFG
ncbi:DNA polymerase Y family protein [Endothiovibrio diazotrophicus]